MKVIYLSTVVPEKLVKEASTSRIVENNMALGAAEMLHAIYKGDMKCITIQPRLKEKGYEKKSLDCEIELNENLTTRIVKAATTPFLQIPTGLVSAMREVSALLKQWKAEGETTFLLITYNAIPPICIVQFLIKKLYKIKTACILLDAPVFPRLSSKFKTMVVKFWNLFATTFFRQYDAGMSVASRCVTDFDSKKPFFQLLPGVTQSTIKQVEYCKPVYNEKEIHIMYAGNLSRFNGVDILMEVIENLPSNYYLDIMGSGELQDYVEQCSKRNKRILYHGLVSYDVVLENYKKVNLLILVRGGGDEKSDWLLKYGTSSKLAEMMLSGVPIVTNPIEANPPVFHEYVNCINDLCPTKIAEIIVGITKDEQVYEQYVDKAYKGRMFYLENGLWLKQSAGVKAFLNSIVRGAKDEVI